MSFRPHAAGAAAVAFLAITSAMFAPAATADASSSPGHGRVLFQAKYSASSLDATKGGWAAEQEPNFAGLQGPIASDRIRIISKKKVPGLGAARPKSGALEVTLRPFETAPGMQNGDVQKGGDSYLANRAEVYGRIPTPVSTPPTSWPDPVDSTRWYSFSLLVPDGFVTATDTTWLTLTQWKGAFGGGPPIDIEIKRDGLRLGGTRTNQGLIPRDGYIGPLTRGTWTRLTVGMSLSPDPNRGWVQVFRDGVEVMPRTPVATMDLTSNGQPDPIYIKQGLYRSTAWTVTQTLYFGPLKIGTTKDAVD